MTSANICAVVKADAYGHGLEALNALGDADEFAVSCLREALQVSGSTEKTVNILSLPDKTLCDKYSDTAVPAVASEDDIEFVSRFGARMVNIKINTGMNRYGADPDELNKLLSIADKYRLKVKSVFSHIYDLGAAEKQFDKFIKCVEPVKKYIPQLHILSSNFSRLPSYMHLDMVRAGLVLYGYGHEAVRGAMTASSSITQLREVKADENIGYGNCLSGKRRVVAVLGAGYADGCRRTCDNMPRYVSMGNVLCPVVGQVCMDAMTVDVSGMDVKVGDEVYIMDKYYDAEAIAVSCGTISYEILTGFGKRAVREYIA